MRKKSIFYRGWMEEKICLYIVVMCFKWKRLSYFEWRFKCFFLLLNESGSFRMKMRLVIENKLIFFYIWVVVCKIYFKVVFFWWLRVKFWFEDFFDGVFGVRGFLFWGVFIFIIFEFIRFDINENLV